MSSLSSSAGSGSSSRLVALGVGAAILAGGAAVAVLYKIGKDEEERAAFASRQVTRTMTIPSDKAMLVLGRKGDNIKEIENKTHTKMRLHDPDSVEAERELIIRGRAEDVNLAEVLVYQILQNQPRLETLTMRVPYYCVGSIIGRGGETVQSMQFQTKCKINVARGGPEADNKKEVTLRGTSDQVAAARRIIEGIVEEEEHIEEIKLKAHTKKTLGVAYKQPLFLTSDSTAASQEVITTLRKGQYERLQTSLGFQTIGVYVSHIVDPEHFYVQKVGPNSVALDKLVQDMTGFYEKEINQALTVLDEVSVGDLVAVPCTEDDRYYRAKVVEVSVDEYDETIVTLDLDLVDFGDRDKKRKEEVFELKTEYLKLNFQAIECSLHNVKQKDSNGDWSSESLDLFESLTHARKWQELSAEVVTFKTVGTVRIPCLQLISHNQEAGEVSIADELVRQGHAIYANEALPGEAQVLDA